MSDILTSFSYNDTVNNDNLSEFLNKLTRFGIDQCLHLTHLISNKQKSSIILNIQSVRCSFASCHELDLRPFRLRLINF